jgi:hypothetical protein
MAIEGKPLTASVLSKGLEESDLKSRLEGRREMHCIMEFGKPPEVSFIGFWNATFLRGAFNCISKAYRLRRAKPGHKPNLNGGVIK